MRRSAVLFGALMLSLTSACPTAHRRNGSLDRATRVDIRRQLKTEGCKQKRYEKQCLDSFDELNEEELEECLEACFE